MFYKNWMSYIKDDAKITKIAMPGSHNSGTVGMNKFACCQHGTLYEQYTYGVRFFDIRLKADRKGRVHIAHGICSGMLAEDAFRDLKKIFDETDEFFVLSIRTYMNQGIGPITLSYDGNTEETNRLIKEYLNPEQYALTDCSNIGEMTIGDLRKAGKKYIIINAEKEYEYSTDCPFEGPWNPTVYGFKPRKFAMRIQTYLKEIETDGFFWFQTQQTPNLGTENGWTKWPYDLDTMSRVHFSQIIKDIEADPVMLSRVNIVAGDFMTRDLMKQGKILGLNLAKGIVKEELKDEFINNISE